ncbi:MAG: hypothetical protein PHU56_00815 [Candidatus Pacebacteria bacterium]|nr:hypothetical protein [Candidatus Paceibacterota bacterium]
MPKKTTVLTGIIVMTIFITVFFVFIWQTKGSLKTELVQAQISYPQDDSITWQSIGPGGGGGFTALAIDPIDENIVYTGGDLSGAFKSTDGGASWKFINNGLEEFVIQEIAVDQTDPNTLYLGTTGGVYKSTNKGETWQRKRSGFPAISSSTYSAPAKAIAIDPNNHNVVYVSIAETHGNNYYYEDRAQRYNKGQIYKTTSGGDYWQAINTPGANGIPSDATIFELAVRPGDSNTVLASTNRGFFKSTDGGVNWTKKSFGLPYDDIRGLAVHPANPDIIYVTVWTPQEPWNGGVFKSTDNGETWVAKNTGLKHRNDGAGSLTSNYPEVIIDKNNPETIFTGDRSWGTYGVQKSTDGGDTWTGLISYDYSAKKWTNVDTLPYGGVNVSTMAISPTNGNKLFFGTSMTLYKTENQGLSWMASHIQEFGSDTWKGRGVENTCVQSLAVNPDDSNLLYLGYADISLVRSKDGGATFHRSKPGFKNWDDVDAIAFDPDNSAIVYVGDNISSGSGTLLKSTNSGNTWTIIGSDSNGLANGQVFGIAIDPKSPQASRIIYAAVVGKGVYKSVNGGTSWSVFNSGLNNDFVVRSLAIDPINPATLYLGTWDNMYKTIDGGTNWTMIAGKDKRNFSAVYSIAVDYNNPNIVYATARQRYFSGVGTLQGGVYKSLDSGETWTKILSEFWIEDIAMNPYDPSILYAGAQAYNYFDAYRQKGLYRTKDGGQTWTLISNNLPHTNISALAIDKQDPRVIYIGTGGGGVFKGIDYSIPLPVQKAPNIAITMTADKTQAYANEEVAYTISFQNIGDGPARNIIITDTIPNGMIYIAGSATGGGTLSSSTLTWNVVALDAGESGSVSFRVRVE